MTVTLGSLALGYVEDISYVYMNREGAVEVPGARGASVDLLGTRPMQVALGCELTGSSRFSNLLQLNRYRMIGESLKLHCDLLKTVARIKSVGLTRQKPVSLLYELILELARFKQVDGCDATDDWSVQSGGGALSAITSNPDPLEGSGALKLATTTPGAGTPGIIRYDPSDLIDVNDFDWVALWFRTNNIADLTDVEVICYVDGSNYAVYDFVAEVTAIDTWYRLRAKQEDFTVTGTMEWDAVDYIEVEEQHSTDQSFTFIIDDLGAFE